MTQPNSQRTIKDPAKPTPTEISFLDYQTLARKYLKQLCGNLRTYAMELSNLHKKRGQIMREYNRRGLMVYPYAIWQAHAQHVAWDGIEWLSPQGKKGAFAVAVQSLPNNRNQFTLFRDWLEDLKSREFLSPETQIHVVSPFTSEVCPRCYAKNSKQTKNRDQTTAYHESKCTECGYMGSRHSTAAMVEAVEMKHIVEGFPSC